MPGRFTITVSRKKSKSPSPPKTKKSSPKTKVSTLVHRIVHGIPVGTKLSQKEFAALNKKSQSYGSASLERFKRVNRPASIKQAKAKRTLREAYKKAAPIVKAKHIAKTWRNLVKTKKALNK